MSRFAAVFCHHTPCLRVLRTALDEAGIDYVHCRSQQQALELTLGEKCSVLIADFVLPEAGEVARLASLLPPLQKPVVLAIAGEYPGTGEAFQSGANRILYRPLLEAQVKEALHDALESRRKLARPDRRRISAALAKENRRAARRRGIKTLVYLDLESGTRPAIGIDVSEQGFAVQAAEPVPALATLPFRCLLPGTTHTLRGQADVIWTDQHGRAGMFFSYMPPSSRKLLKDWLARSSSAHSANAVRMLLPPEGVALFS